MRCGIIEYIGTRDCKPLLLAGLEAFESRGYDSAGLALLEHGALSCTRAVGDLSRLKTKTGGNSSRATTGVGHTRWATHGGVAEANAHPLCGCDGRKLSIRTFHSPKDLMANGKPAERAFLRRARQDSNL